MHTRRNLLEGKAQQPAPVDRLRTHRRERLRGVTTLNRQRNRTTLGALHLLGHLLPVTADAGAIDRENPIAWLQAGGRSRLAGDVGNIRRRLFERNAVPEEDGKDHKRGNHVGTRAGQNNRDATPDCKPPIRTPVEVVTQTRKVFLGLLVRLRMQQVLVGIECKQRAIGCRLAVSVEHDRALQLGDGWAEDVALAFGTTQLDLLERVLADDHIVCLRAVHADNSHVAAERNRTEAVLRLAAREGEHNGRKADQKTRRLGADETCHHEMTELVDQDQQQQADDHIGPAHA